MGGLFSGIVMPPAGKVNALEGPGTDRKKLAGAWGAPASEGWRKSIIDRVRQSLNL